MPSPTVEFLGLAYRRPTVAGAFRAKPQPSGLGVDLNTQILIGDADNGWHANDSTLSMEERVMQFRSFDEARLVLGAGDLLDAIKAAFRPSKDARFGTGPRRILALNTRANVRATITLAHIASGTYVLRARIPGPRGNTIRLRIADNGDRFEMRDDGESFSATGLAVADLELTYTGNATTAVLAYDGVTLSATLTGATDSSASFSLPVADVRTIRDLADRVSNFVGFEAVVLTNPDIPVQNLDHVASANLKSGPARLRAQLWRQLDLLGRWGFCEVPVISGTRQPLADTSGFVYLSGGARGASSANDYIQALALQRKQNGFYLNVCTTIPAVHAALFDEVIYANSPAGTRERFAGCGADVTQNFVDRLAAGRALNSEYIVFGAVPVTLYRADGVTLKTFDGWMLAVLHNAIKAAANVRETAFNKALNIVSAPESETTDVERAIENGCLVVDRKSTGELRLAYDCTTYNATNLIYNKAQLICLAMALNKDLRVFLEEQFQGEVPVDPRARGAVLTDAKLRKTVRDRFNRTYVGEYGWLTANEYTGAPAWDENFTIERQGTAVYFIFPDGTLVTSLDFIFSLLNFDVVRGASNG